MRCTRQFVGWFLSAWFALGATQPALGQALNTGEELPAVEIFAGYSYLRADTIDASRSFGLNGASGSVAYNFNRVFGVVADFGFYHQGNLTGDGLSLNLSSYQAGPRFSLRNRRYLTPFAQALVGVGHAGGTLYTAPLGAGLAPLGATNALMVTAGVGLDWKLNHTIGIRLLQAEYLYSRFPNGSSSDNRQNNIRLSAGVLFSFGNR
jgi:hypothetical protein